MTRRIETGVTMMTTRRVLMGTQPTASLHQRNKAEDTIDTTVTCVTSSMTEMHVVKLKTDTEIRGVKSKNSTM
jgi:hypothetical protein